MLSALEMDCMVFLKSFFVPNKIEGKAIAADKNTKNSFELYKKTITEYKRKNQHQILLRNATIATFLSEECSRSR